MKHAGQNEARLVMLLMLSVAGLGAVMSSTGVVALIIPVASSIAMRLNIPVRRIVMPLSFAGLIGSWTTNLSCYGFYSP